MGKFGSIYAAADILYPSSVYFLCVLEAYIGKITDKTKSKDYLNSQSQDH